MHHFAIRVLLSISLAITAPTIWGQISGNEGSRELRGQLRFENGVAAPAGVAIRLESRASGAFKETVSDSAGQFDFQPLERGDYIVTVASPEYQSASQQVDLTVTPHGFAALTLHAKSRNSVAVPPEGPTSKISLADLSIPENARKEFSKGEKLLLEQHQPARSLDHFRRAIERCPHYAAAFLFQGIAHMQLRDWTEAQSSLEQALQLDDALAPAYLALGALFNEQGKYAAAEQPLARALLLDAKSAMIHYEAARTSWALGRLPEAEKQVQTALEIQPDLADAHVLMGNLMLQRGQPQMALTHFREYIRLAPSGPMVVPAQKLIARIEQQASFAPAGTSSGAAVAGASKR